VLRSIIISPAPELAARLEAAVTATGEITVGRTLNRYPNAIDLVRTLRAHAPEVVFLSFESLEKAQEVVKFLEAEAAGLPVIAIHSKTDPTLLRQIMRAGVRDFLAEPFERSAILEALSAVKTLIERHPPALDTTGQIFAFLPSRRPDTKVLLADFDLNSGMMRFMLKLQNEYSVIDAVENALRVDEHLWPQLVTSLGALDVLHAGRVNPHLRVEGAQIRALIDFARRNYQALCFDLSGNLERYSLEIMQDCKRILLVCTQEIPSLHLAREKIAFLRNFDLDTRVSVILNRCLKKASFSKAQVEEILGMPVLSTFPNDYLRVNRSLTEGKWVAPDSDLGKSFATFAEELLERRVVGQGDTKKKFLEFFAVPPRTVSQ
jgi:Flp pilus assembly CpaE family ATPase